jgi:uncharacterized membrane protein YedE/YeeE
MHYFSALLSGLIFGLGLILSGMTNTAKVIGFLDIAGQWDPSLIFVMIGAIAVSFIGFKLVYKNNHTLLGEQVTNPANTTIDKPLIIGATLFGIGWGLAGFCPGPALASLSMLKEAGTFVAAMLFGMLIFEVTQKLKK